MREITEADIRLLKKEKTLSFNFFMVHASFTKWMDDLRYWAERESIDLESQTHSYYTYFARGFTPKDVIGDFNILTDKANDAGVDS